MIDMSLHGTLLLPPRSESAQADHPGRVTRDPRPHDESAPSTGRGSSRNSRLTGRTGLRVIDGAEHRSTVEETAQRLFDVIVASVLLLLCSPLLLAIAALIRVTGPAFYSQERVGKGGRRFRILKFRSMCVDAEKETGPVFARNGDARCTPLGGWLRRTCLDELPQLWNVLRGDMSLVGPRPERPQFVDQFRTQWPHYDLRHRVRPGITGWAQVNGWRGCTSLAERLRFDLDYVQRRSLRLDLRILLHTPAAVIFPQRVRRLEFDWNRLLHPGTGFRGEPDWVSMGDRRARAA